MRGTATPVAGTAIRLARLALGTGRQNLLRRPAAARSIGSYRQKA